MKLESFICQACDRVACVPLGVRCLTIFPTVALFLFAGWKS